MDTINTLPTVLSSTQQQLQTIPSKIDSAKISIGQSVDQVRESINNTIVSISTIPQVVNSSTQTVSKVSEDVVVTVSAIPDVVDANLKVIASIPDEINSKTNLLIEKTTNFPSYVQTEVNSTISRIQKDIDEKKKRVIAVALFVKSIVLFPYDATMKAISVVQIISNQIDELRSELAGEITPEKAERLRQRALIRKSQLESRQNVINTYDATKRFVYEFFDTVENLIINLQGIIEEAKKTPEKMEGISRSINAKIEDVKQTPARLSRFQQSMVDRIEEVKQTPTKVQRSVENFQNNLRKTQRDFVNAGSYLWRVITLEEAKASIASTQRKLKATQDSLTTITTNLREPGLYVQRVVKKNTALKILSWMVGITKDIAVGAFQAVSAVVNATLTAKDDEYVKYLFSKKSTHGDNSSSSSEVSRTTSSAQQKSTVRDVTKLTVEALSDPSSPSSVTLADSSPPSKKASSETVTSDPAPSEPMSFEEWCKTEASDRNLTTRKP